MTNARVHSADRKPLLARSGLTYFRRPGKMSTKVGHAFRGRMAVQFYGVRSVRLLSHDIVFKTSSDDDEAVQEPVLYDEL